MPRDKQALLAFKDGLLTDEGLLSSWNNATDPCDDDWAFLSCNCSSVYPPLSTAECSSVAADPGNRRVLVLEVGSVVRTQGRQLGGSIANALGNLTELRTLDLHGNRLEGTLPQALGNLTNLRQFILSGNALVGSVPAYVGAYPGVGEAWLARNNLSGQLTDGLCSNSVGNESIHLEGNPGLCGIIPSCLLLHIPDLSGTSLIDPTSSSRNPDGGLCEAAAPACDPAKGCGVLVPPYWTSVHSVAFSFTPFTDSMSGNISYEWGLASQAGLDNVIPFRPFAGILMVVPEVAVAGKVFSNVTLHVQNVTTHFLNLVNGMTYYVSVRATSGGAQRFSSIASSGPVEVDQTPPMMEAQGQVYNAPGCQTALTQTDTTTLWVCWDPFVDDESPIIAYSYQVYKQTGDKAGRSNEDVPVTPEVRVALSTLEVVVQGLQLQVGSSYYVRVRAMNAAGIEGFDDSQPIKIAQQSQNLSPQQVAGIVLGAVIGTGILVAALAIYLTRIWTHASWLQRRQARERAKQLKNLMTGLMANMSDGSKRAIDDLCDAREMAFVVTDLESSTAQASASAAAFAKVQEIHDTLLREAIARHGGYEINTEGDSFHIAFKSVVEAVGFCMDAQYQLLETPWTRDVLRLPTCREVLSPDGGVAFRGPRVRMGIHFAAEGTVAHRLHLLTKHRVFSGPGFQLAQELGEVANGGQVLLSQEAWVRLRGNMFAAGFPVVEQLGLYKLNAWPVPICIYQIKQLMTRPLSRTFGPLRRIELVEPGAGYNVTPPPQLGEPKVVTFVAARLALTEQQIEKLTAPPTSSRLMLSSGTKAHELLAAAPATAKKLQDILAIVAQQFAGYMFNLRVAEGRCLVCFGAALDAVRFCHAAQVALLFQRWPSDCAAVAGPTELTPDNRPLFAGPRIAMAVHTTPAHEEDPSSKKGAEFANVRLDGGGEVFTEHLADAVCGGQVVLSETTWSAIQDHIPGQPQVISLGVHVVHDVFPGAMLLMEVMPSLLARRSFPRPATERCLEPGFRDSPDPSAVALVFIRAAKPATVVAAESSAVEVEGDVVATMEAYNLAMGRYTRTVRGTLPDHAGYECKEPEPGKFTLAFPTLEAAVRWCVELQLALLHVDWPEAMLRWPDCAPETDPSTGTLLFRGLRVRMGMAFGRAQHRKPLNTGRADYYGALANLAARVSALAAPGQVLVEGSAGLRNEPGWERRDDGWVLLPRPDNPKEASHGDVPIELEQLGYYMLKGMDDAKLIFQAVTAELAGRKFAPPSAAMRVSYIPRNRMRFSVTSSFVSGTSGSGDSGHSSGLLFPANIGHLLRLPARSSSHSSKVKRGAKSHSALRTRSFRGAEQSAPSELVIHRSTPSTASPWGSFAESMFRRVRSLGQPRSPTAPGRPRRVRTSQDIELGSPFEEAAGREGLPGYAARRHSAQERQMSGEDVLVPVALEAASEEGSPMISPSPSGSLHCAEASSPSGSVRQHGAFMRVRRLDWGPGDDASASSSFDGGGNAETVAASGASGLVARMAVQRAGSIGNPLGLGRSWSANDRAGPSPLSEASGPSGGVETAGSAPLCAREAAERIRGGSQSAEPERPPIHPSSSSSFTQMDTSRLQVENAAYARQVAELFASSRRSIGPAQLDAAAARSSSGSGSGSGSFTSAFARARSASTGHPSAAAASAQPTQDSRLMRQQQHPRSNSTGAIKREDVAAAAEQQQLRGPRSKSAEVEALSKKRGITWRDRMGLSSAPLASTSKEGPLEVASRERSYQGSLPDVHEEMELSGAQLAATLPSTLAPDREDR
ncbi:g10493 [Coccomyxa elongata]